MKKLGVLGAVTVFVFLSFACGSKDINDITALHKRSQAALEQSFLKQANAFFLYEDMQKNGSIISEVSLTGSEILGTYDKKTERFLKNLIDSKLGLKTVYINNEKAKEYKYAYFLKNLAKQGGEDSVLAVKIDEKNIEAASPSIYNKTFFIPAKNLSKLVSLAAMGELDLSYSAIKRFLSFKTDKASKKRYEQAETARYKNADIKKTENGYIIQFNIDSLKESSRLLGYAIKNDSRLQFFIDLLKKIRNETLSKGELDEADNFLKQLLDGDNPILQKTVSASEELEVKNGLIAKQSIKYLSADNSVLLETDYEIGDYDFPFNRMKMTASFAEQTFDGVKPFGFSFTSEGNSSDSVLDAECTFGVNTVNSLFSDMSFRLKIRADSAKENDNFYIEEAFSFKDIGGAPNLVLNAAGDFKKTEDKRVFNIKTVFVEISDYEEDAGTLASFTVDASVTAEKGITNDFSMPQEKIDAVEIGFDTDKWKEIGEEVFLASLTFMNRLYRHFQ